MFPRGSDLSRSLFQQKKKKKRKILFRKDGGITRKNHVPAGARISWCLCWNGTSSPFKREKLTELQQFSYFCGNNSSNLQASAHPEGTATPGSRDVTEMPRNRAQLENHSWEIRKRTEGNNFTSSAQWTHTVARLQHRLDRISLKKRTQERLIYTP